jgi:hypothetical protein
MNVTPDCKAAVARCRNFMWATDPRL